MQPEGGTGVHTEDIMMSSKEHVKRLFTERVAEWAACYSDPEPRSLSGQSLISRQRIALEMVEAGVPPASKVLDVGCGTGEMAARLMRRGYEVWGLDITDAMIRYARERCGSDRFRVGDMEHLPFPAHTFDAVVCLGVIEYLDKDERALREIWRVLKPGGTAVVSTPSAICPFYYLARMLVGVMNAARPLYDFVAYRLRGRRIPARQDSPDVRHRRYYRRKWLRLLRSEGLEMEQWVCHSWGWYSNWLGPLAQRLSPRAGLCRDIVDRVGPARLYRRLDGVARSRALNWLLAEQIVRVRAVKNPSASPRMLEGSAFRSWVQE